MLSSSIWKHSGDFSPLFFVLKEPRDFFSKDTSVAWLPTCKASDGKVKLASPTSFYLCVLSCATFNYSITNNGSGNNRQIFSGDLEQVFFMKFYVFCLFILLTDPVEQKEVLTKCFKCCWRSYLLQTVLLKKWGLSIYYQQGTEVRQHRHLGWVPNHTVLTCRVTYMEYLYIKTP